MRENTTMKTVPVKTHDELVALGSALTWEGLRLEDLPAVTEWMAKYGAKFKDGASVYVTEGKDMNAAEGLTGSNAYPNDLHIVSFRLEDIENWQKLMLPRFEVGGRWMDDILENNRRREEEKR